jgi:hypothetical protein
MLDTLFAFSYKYQSEVHLVSDVDSNSKTTIIIKFHRLMRCFAAAPLSS